MTVTFVLAVVVTPSRVSEPVIATIPGAIAVTTPALFTTAVPAFAVVKLYPVTPVMTVPFASRAAAVSVDVLPMVKEGVAAVSAIVASPCATVISRLDDAAPLVALTVAVPLPTAVIVAVEPELVTVATDALLEANVTIALGISTCDDDFTAAESVRESPIDASAPDAEGVSTMMLATGAVTLSLHAARMATSAMAAMFRVVRKFRIVFVRGGNRSW